MDQFLLNIVLALATAELLHNIMEASNVRRKVARLYAYINKKPFPEIPVNIDTRPKAYALTIISFVALTGLSLGVLSLMNLKGDTALVYLAVVLTLAFFSLAYLLDKYHVEIERVTKPFKKK